MKDDGVPGVEHGGGSVRVDKELAIVANGEGVAEHEARVWGESTKFDVAKPKPGTAVIGDDEGIDGAVWSSKVSRQGVEGYAEAFAGELLDRENIVTSRRGNDHSEAGWSGVRGRRRIRQKERIEDAQGLGRDVGMAEAVAGRGLGSVADPRLE